PIPCSSASRSSQGKADYPPEHALTPEARAGVVCAPYGKGLRAMSDLTIWTYDWVPEGPRGFVRDLRLRWACEEAGLAYAARTGPLDDRQTNHLDRQPFGQVPFLDDGELKIFESGAALLHLARKSDRLMPTDPAGEAATVQWTIAALNSIEMATVP